MAFPMCKKLDFALYRRCLIRYNRLPSERRTHPVCQFLYHRTSFEISTCLCIPKFCSTVASTTIIREESEISNIAGILDQFRRVAESDDFTYITFHPVVQDCIRVLLLMKEEEYVRLAEILFVIREKFDDLYDCDCNMTRISKHFDGIFREWLRRYEPEEILKMLPMSKILTGRPDFTIDVIKHLKKALQWPAFQMLRYVEHMNENKLWNIYHVDKYDLEYAFSRNFSSLNIDQAAIILEAMIYLKTDITISDLPRKLFELFLEKHSVASLSTINIFVQFFSRLVHCFWDDGFNVHELLPSVTQVFSRHVDSWPLDSVIHAASFCRRIICYDDVFFKKLARRMLSSDVLHVRCDMIDQLVMAVVYFNGLGYFTEELTRFLEISKVEPLKSLLRSHPKRLVSIINNLGKVGVYDEYFLELILSNGFLVETYKKLDHHYVSVNVYSLNQNVEAEYDKYDGRRLDENLRQSFEKTWYGKFPKLFSSASSEDENFYTYCRQASAHQRLVHEMRQILHELLTEECVHTCWMHPHIPRLNFIFAMKNGIPIKLDEKIKRSHCLVSVSDTLDREYRWYAFKFLTRNALYPHEPLLLYNGINSARLLTNMGVDLISFVGKDWKRLDRPGKLEHLRKLIFHRLPNARLASTNVN